MLGASTLFTSTTITPKQLAAAQTQETKKTEEIKDIGTANKIIDSAVLLAYFMTLIASAAIIASKLSQLNNAQVKNLESILAKIRKADSEDDIKNILDSYDKDIASKNKNLIGRLIKAIKNINEDKNTYHLFTSTERIAIQQMLSAVDEYKKIKGIKNFIEKDQAIDESMTSIMISYNMLKGKIEKGTTFFSSTYHGYMLLGLIEVLNKVSVSLADGASFKPISAGLLYFAICIASAYGVNKIQPHIAKKIANLNQQQKEIIWPAIEKYILNRNF